MATIKAIDGQTVHRIQSGQVVVDLCSVVKELVENSLDAGGTVIDVRFKNQGLDLIEVQDNGSGISPANYQYIALKHHTSKLSTYDDIGTLETFGFRGEALASLCALSSMTVVTCLAEEAPKGSKLTFEPSGKLENVTVVAAQRGTTVSVANLFHNLPVRRRELERNIKREWQKVITLLNQYACIQTKLKFSVSQQPTKGKRILLFSTKGNTTTRDNIINIFGAKASQNLVALDLSLEFKPTTSHRLPSNAGPDSSSVASNEVKVVGHVSRPTHGDGRQTPDRQMFFVNSRPCSLPQFAKVFNEVYRSYNSSQSPFILADIRLDTHLYDVNVSPDKRTILLHEQNHLLETLRSSLTQLFDAQDQTVPAAQLLRTFTPASRVSNPDGDAANRVTPTKTSGSSPANVTITSTARTSSLTSTRKESAQNRIVEAEPRISATSTPLPTRRRDRVTSEYVKSSPFDRWLAGGVAKNSQASRNSSQSTEDPESPDAPSEIGAETFPESGNASDSEVGKAPRNHLPSKRQLSSLDDPSESQIETSDDDEPPAKRQDTRAITHVVDSSRGLAARQNPSRSKPAPPLDTYRDESPDMAVRSEMESESGERSAQEKGDAAEAGGLSASQSEVEDNDDDEQDDEEQDDEEQYDDGEEEDQEETREERVTTYSSQDVQSRSTSRDGSQQFKIPSIKDDSPRKKTKSTQSAGSNLLQPILRRKGTVLSLLQTLSLDEESIWSAMRYWVDFGSRPGGHRSHKQQRHVEDIAAPDAESKLPLIIAKSDFGKMRVTGQFNLGFIVAVRPADKQGDDPAQHQHDELFIIDQHASDEKYNFERLQDTTIVQSQRLVVPKQLELTALEEEIVMQSIEAIEANGFKIDVDMDGQYPVGQRCQLTALPLSRDTTFTLTDLEELIALLGDESVETRVIPRPSKVRKMFAMRACRSSVMIGKPLTLRQMYSLTNHMGELDKPWNCPHGRPTMRHLCRLDAWDGMGWNKDATALSAATWSAYARGD